MRDKSVLAEFFVQFVVEFQCNQRVFLRPSLGVLFAHLQQRLLDRFLEIHKDIPPWLGLGRNPPLLLSVHQ